MREQVQYVDSKYNENAGLLFYKHTNGSNTPSLSYMPQGKTRRQNIVILITYC